MSDETYNGWANYPTWSVNMWLSNDESIYNEINELVAEAGSTYDATQAIESYVAELLPELEGFPSDLLGYAVELVNFRDIAVHWIDDLEIEVDSDGDYVSGGDDDE